MAKKKCSFPDGYEVTLGDDDTPLDPCIYEEVETHYNCIVHVLRCSKCGHFEITWEHTYDEEDEEEDANDEYGEYEE